MTSSNVYSCLYSKHKTQKRKVWQDGKLTISATGTASLTAISTDLVIGANASTGQTVNHALDSVVISLNDVQCIKNGTIAELEMEKFLLQIEGPYNEIPNHVSKSSSISNDGPPKDGRTNKLAGPSNRMQKLISRKFKVPQKVMAQQPSQHTSQSRQYDFMKRRKRPLQPGEWARQCQMQMISSQNDGGNIVENHQTNFSSSKSSPNNWNQQNPSTNNNNITFSDNQQRTQHNACIENLSRNTRYCNPQKENQNLHDGNLNWDTNERHKMILAPSQEQTLQSSNARHAISQNVLHNNHNTDETHNNVSVGNKTSSAFISNDFDPSSFYGSDDGDDSESDGAFDEHFLDKNSENVNKAYNDSQAMDKQQSYNQSDHGGDYNETLNLIPSRHRQSQPLLNDDDESSLDERESSSAENNDGFLSRSDLLKLFTHNGSKRNNSDESGDDGTNKEDMIQKIPCQEQKNMFLDNLLQAEAAIDCVLSNPDKQGTSNSSSNGKNCEKEWDVDANHWIANDCCDDAEKDFDRNDCNEENVYDTKNNDNNLNNDIEGEPKIEHDQVQQRPTKQIKHSSPHQSSNEHFSFDINFPSESDSSCSSSSEDDDDQGV